MVDFHLLSLSFSILFLLLKMRCRSGTAFVLMSAVDSAFSLFFFVFFSWIGFWWQGRYGRLFAEMNYQEPNEACRIDNSYISNSPWFFRNASQSRLDFSGILNSPWFFRFWQICKQILSVSGIHCDCHCYLILMDIFDRDHRKHKPAWTVTKRNWKIWRNIGIL